MTQGSSTKNSSTNHDGRSEPRRTARKASDSLPTMLDKIRIEEHEKPEGVLCTIRDWFRRGAAQTAKAMGSAWTFAAAVMSVVIWGALGHHYQYSENWQLVINTGTTIITFLMIFLVQNSQNRDSRAIQLKLDELLRGVKGARTALVDLEDATDEELEKLQKEFERLRLAKDDSQPLDETDDDD